MKVYWFIFIWAFVFSYIVNVKEKVTNKDLNLKTSPFCNYKFLSVFFAMSALWFFVGYRTAGVGDTTIYISNYINTPSVFEMPTYSSSFLFDLLRRFSKAYITSDPAWWLFLLDSLAMIPLCLTLKRYSVDINISISYFILCGTFEYFFNGSRQLIAICICLYATKYLEENKKIKYTICIIIAFLIHGSAIIMLVGLLIYKFKPWSKTTIFMCFVTLVIVIIPGALEKVIGVFSSGTDYESYLDELNGAGVNFVRFLTVIVPTVLSFVFRDKINEIDSPVFNYCVNMSLVGSLIYFVALFMTALVAVRIAAYFLIFNMLLYPFLFEVIIGKESKIYRIIFYVCYLIFFYYQMHINYGGLHYISAPLGIYA